jgi:hypothetical protein
MRRTDPADVRIVLHLVGNVGHEARLHEVRHEDEIDRQYVRHVAGGCGRSKLCDHLRAWNDGKLDFVVVPRIPGLHDLSGQFLTVAPHPHAEGRPGHDRGRCCHYQRRNNAIGELSHDFPEALSTARCQAAGRAEWESGTRQKAAPPLTSIDIVSGVRFHVSVGGILGLR